MMKKYIKILGIIIAVTIVLGLIFCFIDNISKSTGANNRGVIPTDNISGIN